MVNCYNLSLCLQLQPYLVYASSKGSSEYAHLHSFSPSRALLLDYTMGTKISCDGSNELDYIQYFPFVTYEPQHEISNNLTF